MFPEEFLPSWDVPSAGRSLVCPHCQAPRGDFQTFCPDCGYVFPEEAPPTAPPPELPPPRLRDRYDIGRLLSERDGIVRYHGLDTQTGRSVVVIRARPVAAEAPVAEAVPAEEVSYAESLPVAEETQSFTPPAWPSLAWEQHLLEMAQHPSLPVLFSIRATKP